MYNEKLNKQEVELIQEAIETAINNNSAVILPELDTPICVGVITNQFRLDGIYWTDGKELFSIWMESECRGGSLKIPGLFVKGTYTPDNFSSGDLSMIRPENRVFKSSEHNTDDKNIS